LITSVGHRADPGFLAGDISHKPGGRLLSLSTRPVVTFPAKEITPLGLGSQIKGFYSNSSYVSRVLLERTNKGMNKLIN